MANPGGKALYQQIDRLLQNGTVAGLNDAELLERYLSRRDEAAFEAIVRLHGPLVLGLCRRLLHDQQEVEDAFQATFLILVRKAPSLRDRTLLANWLYGVAYRVAVRARGKSGRRNRGKQPPETLDEIASDRELYSDQADWMPILDEELTKLPEKYRRPIVLCYLNGQTHEQSAGQLGIPIGTVRSRLARGRDLLKRRLERRGVAPSVLAVVSGGTPPKATFLATVPASLIQGTLAAAGRFLPISSTSIVSTTATITSISLAQGVLTSMLLSQAKVVAIGFLASGLVAGGIIRGVWAVGAPPDERGEARFVQVAAPSAEAKAPPVEPGANETERRKAGQVEQAALETRIRELEGKLERLLSQAPREVRQPEETAPRRTVPMPTLPGNAPGAGMSLPELEAEIGILNRRLIGDRQLLRMVQEAQRQELNNDPNKLITAIRGFDETRDSVRRLIAKLERLKRDIADEVESLTYQRSRKEAELRVEQAVVEVAMTKVARYKRLNDRIKGAVSDEDIAKEEGGFRFAKAQEDVVKADLDYLLSRLKNLQFPANKVVELLAAAKEINLSEADVTQPIPRSTPDDSRPPIK